MRINSIDSRIGHQVGYNFLKDKIFGDQNASESTCIEYISFRTTDLFQKVMKLLLHKCIFIQNIFSSFKDSYEQKHGHDATSA
jgi:hypothetical protein